jgi:hypothetical protein
MFKKWIVMLLCVLGMLAQDMAYAAKKKQVKSAAHSKAKSAHPTSAGKKTATAKHSKKQTKKGAIKKGGKKHNRSKKNRKGHTTASLTEAEKTNRAAPLEMIAQNQEKKRVSDSAHKLVFVNANKDEEGYFATLFSRQKKATSFQTLEGTAAVFKSVSGWEDKKFYILTNELPVGTLVRITTPDLKSICAKVISALPDVSANIKYRLNDAAAAILGITNKTFPISVTY